MHSLFRVLDLNQPSTLPGLYISKEFNLCGTSHHVKQPLKLNSPCVRYNNKTQRRPTWPAEWEVRSRNDEYTLSLRVADEG